MLSYLNKLKDVELFDIVQSQAPDVIYQVLQSYAIEDFDLNLRSINKVDKEGFTALHKACSRGIPEIVEMLLIYGIDINKQNIGGETAALLAAKRGNPLVLKWLKDHGADFKIVDLKGQGMVHCSVYNDNVYVLMWIETSTDLSFNTRDKYGQTPLHLACSLGKINSIKFLLRKSRANVLENTSITRDNCLHLSISNNQLQCVPHILFHLTRKKSLFDPERLQQDEKSSMTLSKNADNKTPIDIFMSQSEDYKASHRGFWYLFTFLQMTSLAMVELNFTIYRVYLFSFPFLFFSLGIILSMIYVRYRVIIFIATSIFCLAYVRTQGHRTSDIDTRPNPIFAGAYVAGVCHDLICFIVVIYPLIGDSQWEMFITIATLPLLLVAYLRLILVDPGRLRLSEVANVNFSEFIDNEVTVMKLHNRGSTSVPLDRFCNVCEKLPTVDHVKHCKICEVCIVDLDHHCLFLMKCIARNNLRNFVVLLILSILLMIIFIETSLQAMMTVCGPLAGANPLEFMLCSYQSQTWVATAVIFNSVSTLWATFMLSYQLSMISHNSTAYFHVRSKKTTVYKRIIRVIYFLAHGSFYRDDHEHRCLDEV